MNFLFDNRFGPELYLPLMRSGYFCQQEKIFAAKCFREIRQQTDMRQTLCFCEQNDFSYHIPANSLPNDFHKEVKE